MSTQDVNGACFLRQTLAETIEVVPTGPFRPLIMKPIASSHKKGTAPYVVGSAPQVVGNTVAVAIGAVAIGTVGAAVMEQRKQRWVLEPRTQRRERLLQVHARRERVLQVHT